MGLVVSAIIGTGVFTSLGFQLLDVQNTWSIVLLWVLGGIFALIGAFTFAELGTHFQELGGDYIYLSRIFHPFVGYIYAWASLTVGFSAPIALTAIAMADYLAPLGWGTGMEGLGIALILILSLVHSFSVRQSGRFQDVSFFFKIVFVLVLIVVGMWALPIETNALEWGDSWKQEALLPGFAVSLIYVTYAYTGWNQAAYIVTEIKEPNKSLPKALIGGTGLVILLYVLLQVVMLRHAGVDQLAGKVEVTYVTFSNRFGAEAGKWVSICIALQLIATMSSYLWVGSRVTYAMAREHSLWKPLSVTNASGIPIRALWLQTSISIALALTGSFEQVLLYAGFVLQLMGTLTIASLLFVQRKPGTFKSPFRPYLQILYILFSIWILGFMLYERPFESLIGIGIVVVGGITYFLGRK